MKRGGFSTLTDYGEPLDDPVQNEIVGALIWRSLPAMARSRPTSPKTAGRPSNAQALLYHHAMRFDAPDKDRRTILCEVTACSSLQSQVREGALSQEQARRGRRASHPEGRQEGRLATVDAGKRRSDTECGEGLRSAGAQSCEQGWLRGRPC
jgi:hypothetical protein